MHAIMGYTALAAKNAEDERQKKYLGRITSSGERLSSLLDELLDRSSLEADRLQPRFSREEVVTLLRETVAECGNRAEGKKKKIEVSADQPVYADIDPALFRTALLNLLSNAIRFSPEDSTISIDLQTPESGATGNNPGYLRIALTDQGIGIADSELETIFEKFTQGSRTPPRSCGLGLGLAIARQIVELHQGRIHAESPPAGRESGSVFIVTIPLASSAAPGTG
jgi:signal transduction histidine kinase